MSFNELDKPEEYVSYLLSKAISIVSKNYIGKVDYDKLFLNMISSIKDSLDSYSNVILNSFSIQNSKNALDNVRTVYSGMVFIANEKIGFIKISSFEKNTVEEFEEVIDNYKSERITHVVVDVRNNMGGNVNALVNICKLLFKKGVLFVSKDKFGNITKHESLLGVAPFSIDIALISRKTMSSAELFCQVIRDNGGILIGEKTFGKSVSQTDYPIGNAVIRLSTKEYLNNKYESYSNIGIYPDIELPYEQIFMNSKLVPIIQEIYESILAG